MRVSTSWRRRSAPSSASCALRLPSKSKGLVTTATVSAPSSRAICGHHRRGAGARAAAHAGGDEDHVRPAQRGPGWPPGPRGRPSRRSRELPPAPRPPVSFVPMAKRVVARSSAQGLLVGVDRDELHVLQRHRDHAVDGVGAAAAHADDLDDGRTQTVRVEELYVHVPSPSKTRRLSHLQKKSLNQRRMRSQVLVKPPSPASSSNGSLASREAPCSTRPTPVAYIGLAYSSTSPPRRTG